MTNQEILEKAIIKARDGGWKYLEFNYNGEPGFTKKSHEVFDEDRLMFTTDWQTDIPVYNVIFDHGFAESIWPGMVTQSHSCSYPDCDDIVEEVPAWKYHLQMMVTASDPIAYLGANI